jgi:hypothetical protein
VLIALGDLKRARCTFSFDEKGELLISFPDNSRIIDFKEGIRVLDGDDRSRKSDAQRWLEEER